MIWNTTRKLREIIDGTETFLLTLARQAVNDGERTQGNLTRACTRAADRGGIRMESHLAAAG